ncbi:MAG: nucleoside triphosphate pyrophosphohydrolase family protein [Saprospiraceae bacterium]|nr:nucleoside triphosphate pyrophosphohydrolase family protein [Saprospiraceae bacterium]
MDFKEAKALNGVAKFHRTFGMPVVESPAIPPVERCKLRIALLQEELDELKDALENNDIVEAADALADLQYVLSGAILELGLGEKFHDLFEEVQRSNMSKTCKTLEEVEATQKYYLEHKSTESYVVEKETEFLVYRKEDGKVLKSIKYSPADFEAVLAK